MSTRYLTSKDVVLTNEREPKSFEDVESHKDKQRWIYAMEEEMNSVKKNYIYNLVKLSEGINALRNKWVFRLNKNVKQF